MKAFPLKHGRIIDFEGTRKTGIKQASIIDISDFEIASHYEYLSTDGKFSDWLITNRNTYQIEFWVAHNVSVEKNIINEHAPYQSSYKQKSNALQWGPWIDTLVLYNRLYANLGDYSLKNLCKIFLDSKEVSQLADQLCFRTSPIFHQSMFDCVVTFLLINRLRDQIDLKLFIDV